MKRLTTTLWLLLSLATLYAQQLQDINNVALFLHDRVEILDFAGPMEVFIAAGFNVYTVGETREPIKAMRKLTIVPDYSLEDCPVPDVISFFGGGGAGRVAQKENVQAWMAEVLPQTDLQFSVCTGAFFLGEMGLLDHKTATTFHSAIPLLQERFPKANIRDDVRFVDNGSVITTAGISAGIDGALHLVAKIKGKDHAIAVAENMEYFGWEPEKGLVIKPPFLQMVQDEGLHKGLQSADANTQIFPGELLTLAHELTATDQDKALEVYDYLIHHYRLSAADCKLIRKAFISADRSAPPSQKKVLDLIKAEQYDEVQAVIKSTQKDFPYWSFFREGNLNYHGYQLLSQQEFSKAIAVFKLNVLAFPKSFNTYDSLGEAYMQIEEWGLAIKNYHKSIELNPTNDNGRKMLEKIEALQTAAKKRIEK